MIKNITLTRPRYIALLCSITFKIIDERTKTLFFFFFFYSFSHTCYTQEYQRNTFCQKFYGFTEWKTKREEERNELESSRNNYKFIKFLTIAIKVICSDKQIRNNFVWIRFIYIRIFFYTKLRFSYIFRLT